MWDPDEISECPECADVSQLLDLSAKFDAEPGIASLRRGYVLARLGGWDQTAALRIAIRNVLAILDADSKPKLEIVK